MSDKLYTFILLVLTVIFQGSFIFIGINESFSFVLVCSLIFIGILGYGIYEQSGLIKFECWISDSQDPKTGILIVVIALFNVVICSAILLLSGIYHSPKYFFNW